MWTAQAGHTECVRLIVEGGADMDAKDKVSMRMWFSLPELLFVERLISCICKLSAGI